SAASAIIDQPSAHNTISTVTRKSKLNCIDRQRMMTASSRINHSPRVTRKRESPSVPRRRAERYAPVPVSRKKVGAQKCVIHRVKNNGAVVVARLVGSTLAPPK